MEHSYLNSHVYVAKYMKASATVQYRTINSIKPPGSGSRNVSEPRLLSQVGRLRKDLCAQVSLFRQLEWYSCHYWSVYVAAAVMWLR